MNTWSCSSCSTFHTFTSEDRKARNFKKVCKACGWDQSSRKPFQPTIVAAVDPKKKLLIPKVEKKRESVIASIILSSKQTGYNEQQEGNIKALPC